MTAGLNKTVGITTSGLVKAVFGIYFIFLMLFDANANYLVFSRLGFIAFAGISVLYIFSLKYIYDFSFAARLLLVIAVFTLCSLFGMNFDNSLKQLITLSQIWLLCVFMYYGLRDSIDMDYISKLFACAGICLFVWTMYIYGIGNFFSMLLSGSVRLGAEVSQENVLGMSAAIIACVCIYNVITFKKYLYLIPIVLMVVLVAASGSRKAILILPVAFIGTLFLNNGFKKLWKTLLFIVIVVPVVTYILSLPAFSMINSRLEGLFDFLNNQGGDMSAEMRGLMTEYGIKWFFEKPILGYGLNCYKYLAYNVFGSYSYAHNNYIELLVDTGIIGTVFYYSIYIYLLRRLAVIFKKSRDRFAGLCIIILAVMLIQDIGVVSYITKTTYVYLGICYICIFRYGKTVSEGKEEPKTDGQSFSVKESIQ